MAIRRRCHTHGALNAPCAEHVPEPLGASFRGSMCVRRGNVPNFAGAVFYFSLFFQISVKLHGRVLRFDGLSLRTREV